MSATGFLDKDLRLFRAPQLRPFRAPVFSTRAPRVLPWAFMS